MKKMLSMMLALLMLFSLAACGGGSDNSGGGESQVVEEYVQITNELGVDLTDLTVSAEDGSGSVLVAETFNDGETYQFSLVDVCGDLEGWVDITAYNEAGDLYKINGKIYDGIEAAMKGGSSHLYIEFPYDGSIGQCSGEIIPGKGTVDPMESNAEDYYGEWEYEDLNMTLYIYGDGTYEVIDSAGDSETGTFSMEDGLLVLSSGATLYLNDGVMVDQDGNTLIPVGSGGSTSENSAYWGFYEFTDSFLEISEGATFRVIDFDGNVIDQGPCEYVGDGVILTFQNGVTSFWRLDEDGDLLDDEGGYVSRIREEDQPLDLPNGGLEENDDDGNYGYSAGDYQGHWMYDNGALLLIEGGNWGIFDDAGDLFATGPVEYEDDGAYLMTEDGSSGGGRVRFDADGDLWDGDDLLIYYDESPYDIASPGGDSDAYQYELIAGEWYYSDQENILTLYDDGTYLWEFADFNESGDYTFDGEWLNFYPTENNAWWPEAVYNSDEDIIIATGDAGSWYYRSSEF